MEENLRASRVSSFELSVSLKSSFGLAWIFFIFFICSLPVVYMTVLGGDSFPGLNGIDIMMSLSRSVSETWGFASTCSSDMSDMAASWIRCDSMMKFLALGCIVSYELFSTFELRSS